MARIIISHFSPIRANGVRQSIVFYDGLIKALIENGNDVLQIITNEFIRTPWNGTNKLRKRFNKRRLYEAVRGFDPDLVISFNNSKIEGVEDLVEAPIVLWDADYFEYFNDKNAVIEDKDRYIFFSFSEGSRNDLRTHVAPRADRLHLVKPATALMARDVPFRDNISFIGSYFAASAEKLEAYEEDPDNVRRMIRSIDGSGGTAFDDCAVGSGEPASSKGLDSGMILNMISGEWRTKVIAAVAPLGLRIFGPREWYTIASLSLDAFLSYDPRLAFSLAHNEDIYNRSRIGINITHSQNVSAYPWRVPDIMATNACLVSDYSRELSADFGKRVPLQTYETPAGAHDICKRLLADETLRADVVAASQNAIRQGFTWQCRLHDISQILGIKLCEPGAAPGRHEILRPAPFLKIRSRLVAEGKRALVDGIDALLDADVRAGVRMPISAKKRRRIRKLIRKEPPRPVYGDGGQLMDRRVKP